MALDAIYSRDGEWAGRALTQKVASIVTHRRSTRSADGSPSVSTIDISLADFDRMLPYGELNDEWMNFMMYHLRAGATKKEDGVTPHVHMFDTFMMDKLFERRLYAFQPEVRRSRTLS